MDFLGKIKNINVSPENIVDITISTDNDTILEELEKFLKSQKNMSIEIKRLYNRRSLDANAYFHFLVNKLARFYKTSDDEMKIKMNLQYGTIERDEKNKCVGVKIPANVDITKFYEYAKWFGDCIEGGIKFNKYLFYKRTHTLNAKEMGDLIEGVVQECMDAGIPVKTKEEIKDMIDNWEPKNKSGGYNKNDK